MRFEFTQDGEFKDPCYFGYEDNIPDTAIVQVSYSTNHTSWYASFNSNYGHNSISLTEIAKKIEELNEQTRRDRIFYWF